MLILENKPPFTVVYKVESEHEIHALCRNELREIRIVGRGYMNLYVNENNFATKKTTF